jgi:uncharacterized membrane protein HdeD (DUF308 family)
MKKSIREFKVNWITTLTGIILLIATILVSAGVITQEQATEINTQSGVVINSVVNIIGAISALILIFKAKD